MSRGDFGGKKLARAKSGMVGALKFLVFIACIIGIPIIGRMFIDTGGTFEGEMGLCLGAWVIALILQWLIGKAFERPTQQYYGQQPSAPYGGYQPPAQAQEYQQSPYNRPYDEVHAREPQVVRETPDVYRETSYQQKRGSILGRHICRDCGGPVDLKSKKCEYCGAWN